MDVVRKKPKSRRPLFMIFLLILITGSLAAGTKILSELEAAVPEYDRSSVILGIVEKGTLIRQVRGPGTLVPKDVTLVTSQVSGTVIELFVQPGAAVEPDTILLQLKDPQMERDVRDAARALKSALADVEQFKLNRESQLLDLKVATATARANYEDAQSQAAINGTLASRELISRRQFEQSRDRAERNRLLLEVQLARTENGKRAEDVQLPEKQALVEQARDDLARQQERQTALVMRAGVSGVLQQLGTVGIGLESGQRISAGSLVAKISNPRELKAVIQISQTQARDVVEGQSVTIDLRNSIIDGRVIRMAPAVRNERVAVDVELTGELPVGARPELSVDGLIEVARLTDVYHVRKPVHSQELTRQDVFRLAADGQTLSRTTVEWGLGSVHSVEVIGGLKTGDQIVISATTRWKSFDKVKLKDD